MAADWLRYLNLLCLSFLHSFFFFLSPTGYCEDKINVSMKITLNEVMEPQQWVRPVSDPLNGKRQQKYSNQTPGGSWWPHLLAATSLSGHFSQCTMLGQHDQQKWRFSLPRLGNKMHFSCHLNWYLSFSLSSPSFWSFNLGKPTVIITQPSGKAQVEKNSGVGPNRHKWA